jgi:hypothetical protein
MDARGEPFIVGLFESWFMSARVAERLIDACKDSP